MSGVFTNLLISLLWVKHWAARLHTVNLTNLNESKTKGHQRAIFFQLLHMIIQYKRAQTFTWLPNSISVVVQIISSRRFVWTVKIWFLAKHMENIYIFIFLCFWPSLSLEIQFSLCTTILLRTSSIYTSEWHTLYQITQTGMMNIND